MIPAGYIVGSPPHNPPARVGTLPGPYGYVPLDPFTAAPQPAGIFGTGTTGTIASNAVEGVLVGLPYAVLLLGYTMSSASADATVSADYALARAPNANQGPRRVDLITGSLVTRSFAVADRITDWPPLFSCPSPVPLPPGWYWLLWKHWSGGNVVSVRRGRSMQGGERCARSGAIAATTRLVGYLDGLGGAAMPLGDGAGVMVPLWSLAVA